MGTVSVRGYGAAGVIVDSKQLSELSDVLAGDSTAVWVGLDRPSSDDMNELAAELGLHHLAVEDALERHQRDKYVHYDDHLFLVCHAVELDADAAQLRTHELDVFVGDRWIVTVHEGQGELLDAVAARWTELHSLGNVGVAFFVYALLDVLLDGYAAAVERFEAYYDDTADRVFAEHPIEPSGQRHWFEMRRALNRFRRVVTPLGEALATLTGHDLDRFAPQAAPYLRDVASEVALVETEVAALNELVNQIVDINLMLRDYRQNAVMKKVTSWAAIIAVPTLVTGYYGMNVPYAGSGETWGVVTATAISLGAAGALYVLFRRKGWI